MIKLRNSLLEIEINSPSEIINWLEDFKKDCERYQTNAKEIVDSGDTNKGCFVESYHSINPEITLKISWKPKFKEYSVINL